MPAATFASDMYADRVELIKEVIARLETAWNDKNALLWASAFTDPCDYVDVWGNYHREWSRADNARLHTLGWKGVHKQSHATFTIEKLQISSDRLAVVVLKGHVVYMVNDEQRENHNVITLLLVHQGVEWLISHFHNTMVKRSAGNV